MRTRKTLAILSLIQLLSLVGCGGGQTPVSAVDAAAIMLAVEGVNKAFNAALAAGDTAAVASLYAEDAALLPANLPRVDGREAIHRWWAEGLSTPGLQLVLIPGRTTVARAGDMATVVGTYDHRAAGPNGTTLREVGKYVKIFVPAGGMWKIAIDTWNSDGAPPGQGG